MYFNESEALINSNIGDRDSLIALDRSLARAYLPNGYGYVDASGLNLWAGLDPQSVKRLLPLFVSAGIAAPYHPAQCPCGDVYDPSQGGCPACGRPFAAGMATKNTRWRVVKRPNKPSFDPLTATGPYDVFISYRHGTSAQLASDLFYSLRLENKNVFLDDSQLPAGMDAERVFHRAASHSPLFLALVSPDYWLSGYCKKEIAHALRSGRRVLLVSVDGGMVNPPDMPFLVGMASGVPSASGGGLNAQLEHYIRSQIAPGVVLAPVYDYQKRAIAYLLGELGPGEITRMKRQFAWAERIDWTGGLDDKINSLLDEAGRDPTRLQELSASVGPG